MKRGLTLLAVALSAGSAFASTLEEQAVKLGYYPNRLVVGFTSQPAPRAMTILAGMGAIPTSDLSAIGAVVYTLPEGIDSLAASRRLSQSGVAYAEPDCIYMADVVPNDSNYASQWALPKISAPAAWDVTLGSTAVKVAVLDTGWDTDHPELVGKVVQSKDFTIANGSPDTWEDGHGHGTHTAGTVAAQSNNSFQVASIGWNTSLMIGKVLSDGGSGSASEIAVAIIWAGDNGAKVVSMSLGGSGTSTAMQQAIEYTYKKNCFVAASAGNSANTSPKYPAWYEPCIAVASTDSTDARSSFSTYGSWVDIAAPGSSILSTARGGGTTTMSGTSMACPHVAGLAALIWSRGAASPHAVRRILIKSGVPVTSGFGSFPLRRINASAAVNAL